MGDPGFDHFAVGPLDVFGDHRATGDNEWQGVALLQFDDYPYGTAGTIQRARKIEGGR